MSFHTGQSLRFTRLLQATRYTVLPARRSHVLRKKLYSYNFWFNHLKVKLLYGLRITYSFHFFQCMYNQDVHKDYETDHHCQTEIGNYARAV